MIRESKLAREMDTWNNHEVVILTDWYKVARRVFERQVVVFLAVQGL